MSSADWRGVICRFPELHALVAIGIPMIMSERLIMALGIPAVGFYVLDFAVVAMIPVIVMQWPEIRERFYRQPGFVAQAIWFVTAAAAIGLLKGYFEGYALRTALRDFRFYFYLPVLFHFGGLLAEVGRLKRVVLGWTILAVVQSGLIYEGMLIYNAVEVQPEARMFQALVEFSSTHYVPLKSYFPLLISTSLLLVAGRDLQAIAKLWFWIFIPFELVVLGFSYSRTLYLAVLGGLAAIVICVGVTRALCVRSAIRSGAQLILSSFGILAVAFVIFQLVCIWHGLSAEVTLNNMQDRVWSWVRMIIGAADPTEMDSSSRERLEGWWISLRDVAADPVFGTGLGNSGTYLRAMAFHNVFLWMAASIGAPAAIVFLLAIVACGLRSLWALRSDSHGLWLRGVWAGVLSCMVALSIGGLFGPYITNFLHLTEWGLLLGVSWGLCNGQVSATEPAVTSERLQARLEPLTETR